MANVSHWYASWVSTEGNDMRPGEAHEWWMAPAVPGDAISVTAQPITGDPDQPHRVLAVENVRIIGEPSDRGGHTMLFTVRNVGSSFIVGYGIGFGFISK